MNTREGLVLSVALGGALLLAFFLIFPPTAIVDPGEYNTTTVTVTDRNGAQLTSVDVRIADTQEKRRIGLMRTQNLANGSGMLFVHPREGTYTYHMQNMSFDIDIIFVAPDGTITKIHHATAPGSGQATDTYTGRGQYVLEVPRGFTNATGIDPGDVVEIPPDAR